MKIYTPQGSTLLDVDVDDNSFRQRQIMGDHSLTLYFSLPTFTEIPIGSYVDYQGVRYTLSRPENLKMRHSRYFEFTIVFEANQAAAKRFKFRNTIDGRLKFPLTATPREHLQMFVDNMNRRDNGWSIGICIDAKEKLINYEHSFCLEALEAIASEFDTEFEIENRVVSLRKVEYNREDALPLSYGKGNGFKPNVGRTNSGDQMPTEVLFVQGGEQNINPSTYGSRELLLPKEKQIRFDGQKFEDEVGFVAANARTYQVSADGLSIQRADKPLSSNAEDSLDCTEFYPKRTGVVLETIVVDEANNFYDIIDANRADNPCPNYTQYLIDGETMTIVFQDGMLAGREFDVKFFNSQTSEKGVTKKGKRFEIVPQEIDGITMPNETFKPKTGDHYVVFHCALPQEYIQKDDTKSGASWDMMRAAVRYLYENEDQKFTFTGELDGIWAKRNWGRIGSKIRLGGFIQFTDERFQTDPVLVRITAIKDFVNNPYSPEITLSNEAVSSGFSSEIKRISANEVVDTEEVAKEAAAFTKRRFRDAKETMRMLEAAMIEGYTQSISPVAAQMLQLIVGDESLQFRFIYSPQNPEIKLQTIMEFKRDTGKFVIQNARYLQHLTLGVNLSSTHTDSEYLTWAMNLNYQSDVLTDPTKAYYVYAKCLKSAAGSTTRQDFLISETAIGMNSVANYYHFLVGILNSEINGDRSFTPLYGFTEISGGRITTDKIQSADGQTYFDLANSEIGGKINFKDGLISGEVAVGEEGVTKAGLNGLGTAADEIRIWAGESSENKNNAPFKVLDNGEVWSYKGYIGSFKIDRNGLFFKDIETNDEMSLSNKALIFKGKIDEGEASAYFGSSIFQPDSSFKGCASITINNDRAEPGLIPRINIGLYIFATGRNAKNAALYITSGAIYGLRHNISDITKSQFLSTMAYIWFIKASNITITLPCDAVEDGQHYEVYNEGKTCTMVVDLFPLTMATLPLYSLNTNQIVDSISITPAVKCIKCTKTADKWIVYTF